MRQHDEVIRAWLDGKTIQRYNAFDNVWVSSENEWLNPKYFNEFEWRVKPEAKTITIPVFSNASNVTAYFDKETREIVIEYVEEAL
jgi:hypothetical protein